MTPEAPQRDDTQRRRPPVRRGIKYAFIAAYLAWLALVPEWATLSFSSLPMLAEEADLGEREAERFQTVSWDRLGGFPYEFQLTGALEDASPAVLAERNARLIPADVRALDRSTVAVRGYVIPVRISRGRVSEFILAAKNEVGCCFGDGLSMNQWIHVAAPEGETFDLTQDGIATVLGVLEVGEEVRRGTVLSLYRMREATVRSG